jgi:hypothetical protein
VTRSARPGQEPGWEGQDFLAGQEVLAFLDLLRHADA